MKRKKQPVSYLNRAIDRRILAIIDRYFDSEKTILDLGCGSGLYGPALKEKCDKLIGLDRESILVKQAAALGIYDQIYCADIRNLDQYSLSVEAIFCSEVLEHISNRDFLKVLRRIESICNKKIVIAVPNPLSPHWHQDPSHILQYNIYSLLKLLNRSNLFQYRLYPLGFSQENLKKVIFRLLNFFSQRIAILSPTVLYVGLKK